MSASSQAVGALRVSGVYDGDVMCPVDDLYARFAIPKNIQVPTRGRASADWIGAYPEYVTDTSLRQTHGAYLIEGLGDRVVLVDAGFGPNLFRRIRTGQTTWDVSRRVCGRLATSWLT
jgi:hypothetical protein